MANSWNFNFFVGIDVSKNKLDLALFKRSALIDHFEIANDPHDIRQLIGDLKTEHGLKIPSAVFGMENTGYYCNHILKILEESRANVFVGDPLKMKYSMGLARGKTDKIDSKRIAQFLVANRENLNLHVIKRPLISKLIGLSSLRSRLVTTKTALKTPLKEERAFIDKSSSDLNLHFCDQTVSSLEKDIAALEDFIKKCWQEDERLKRLMDIICSVPAIGPITALQIILTTNEFKRISSARKFACYAGVVEIPINLTPFRQSETDPLSWCLKRAEVAVPQGCRNEMFSVLLTTVVSTKIHFLS